jgi:hypothetical protein
LKKCNVKHISLREIAVSKGFGTGMNTEEAF